MSEATLWRIEKGLRPVKPHEVETFCNFYHASSEITIALATRAAQCMPRGRYGHHEQWLPNDPLLPARFDVNAALRNEAVRQSWYEPSILPIRTARTPTLSVIVTEHNLRLQAGGCDSVVVHVRHLIDLTEFDERLSVRVVPIGANHKPVQGYSIYYFSGDRAPVVCVPTLTGFLYLDSTDHVHQYREHFTEAEDSALDIERSRKYLENIADDIAG